jgi:WD40 repeat protein
MRLVASILLTAATFRAPALAQGDLFEWSIYRTLNAGQRVTTLAFSPDGSKGAFGTARGDVAVFDLNTPQAPLQVIKSYHDAVVGLAFTADSCKLVSAAKTGEISIRSLGGRDESILTTNGKLLGIAVSRDSNLIATAGENRTVALWDMASNRFLGEVPHGKGPFFALTFAGKDGSLIAVGKSGNIAVWDAKTRAELRGQQDSDQTIQAASIGGGGAFLAVSTASAEFVKGPIAQLNGVRASDVARKNAIKLYDLVHGTVAKTLDVVEADVPALALCPDGNYLAVAIEGIKSRLFAVYDTSRGIRIASMQMRSATTAAAFSEQGEWLGAGTEKGEITIWSVKGGRVPLDANELRGTKIRIISGDRGPLLAPSQPIVLAVADLSVNNTDPAYGRAVADMVRARAGEAQNVRVVERAQIERVFREQNIDMSDRIDQKTAVKLGQMLGAAKMMLGSISQFGSNFTINVHVVSVETGVIDGEREVLCQGCGASDLPEAAIVLRSVLVR